MARNHMDTQSIGAQSQDGGNFFILTITILIGFRIKLAFVSELFLGAKKSVKKSLLCKKKIIDVKKISLGK